MKNKGRLKNWLKDNGKNALGKVLDTIGESTNIPVASNLIEGIGESLMDDPQLSEDQKIELEKIILEEIKLLNEDMHSARDMQKTALNQSDKFSKRFIYYLALAFIFFSMAIVFMLFFVEVPEENQRILDMALGIVIGTGLVSVINFFFGSSKRQDESFDLFNSK